ncbi:hypothetical protein KY084_12505 [Stakelama sp. CBK3Z-3]|uniref:Transmembrane protein n=1 Tax=Stakelama flava TaxID=2860338 RepID=A0ABS6XND3_9SPHN|nr:hypothetical protein [Stakelama flava]MBW4331691.1 hypothetical protein [Stakelama flava]
MTAHPFHSFARPPIAALLPVAAGCVAALAVIALPQPVVEHAIMHSGIPALIPAAAPPLGATARAALALAAAVALAAAAFFAIGAFAMLNSGREAQGKAPAYRRADAHPDAPFREPLRVSRDLEDGFSGGFAGDEPPVPSEALWTDAEGESLPMSERPAPPRPEAQDVPVDLNQRLADFDPDSVPDCPRAPPEPIKPLSRPQTFDIGDRFETFELMPPPRSASQPTPIPAAYALSGKAAEEACFPMTAPETDASVHALLDRLERGIARRDSGSADRARSRAYGAGLTSTLDDLRRMAVGG